MIAWFASVGFLALGGWALARWVGHHPNGTYLWADADEYARAFRGAETFFVMLLACFWLLVFALGTARTRPGARAAAAASGLLVAALVAALLFAFARAAPGMVAGPIDACVRSYYAGHPAANCLDCGIHSCEAMVLRRVMLTGMLAVGALLAASLWFRWRARPIQATL